MNIITVLFGSLVIYFLHFSDAYAKVMINEFLVDPNPEWVELYNSSNSAEYLKLYWLDDDENFNDDSGSSPIKPLINLVVTNTIYPYLEFNSFLNNSGDSIVLFDKEGKVVDSFTYTENPGDGISVGRYPDASGSFVALSVITEGVVNSEPRSSPTPEPTNTPKPTSTPKSTPTPEPTIKPTSKPTMKLIVTDIPTPRYANGPDKESAEDTQVLSARDELNNDLEMESGEEVQEEKNKNIPLAASLLIVGGLSFIGAALYPFIKKTELFQSLLNKRKKEYNFSDDRKQKESF